MSVDSFIGNQTLKELKNWSAFADGMIKSQASCSWYSCQQQVAIQACYKSRHCLVWRNHIQETVVTTEVR